MVELIKEEPQPQPEEPAAEPKKAKISLFRRPEPEDKPEVVVETPISEVKAPVTLSFKPAKVEPVEVPKPIDVNQLQQEAILAALAKHKLPP